MVFEVLAFFLSIFALGVYLLSRDLTVLAQDWYLQRRMTRIVRPLSGQAVAQAEGLFGSPSEVHHGATGNLYVWKGPRCRGIPRIGALVIVTLTTNHAGIVTHAAWERR